jgi:hypothetical protein
VVAAGCKSIPRFSCRCLALRWVAWVAWVGAWAGAEEVEGDSIPVEGPPKGFLVGFDDAKRITNAHNKATRSAIQGDLASTRCLGSVSSTRKFCGFEDWVWDSCSLLFSSPSISWQSSRSSVQGCIIVSEPFCTCVRIGLHRMAD